MKNTTGIIQQNQNTTILLNQLKTAEKQYPTLSKKQEKQLIEKYKNDRIKLNQLLCMHNIRIVFNIAKHYKSKTNDFDNMMQNGYLGLMEAAKRFDITKNIKFVTYAYPWVAKYILSEFYAKNKEIDQNSSSLNQTINFNTTKNNINNSEVEDCVNSIIDLSVSNIKSLYDELSTHEQYKLVSQLLDSMNSDSSLSSIDKNVFMDVFYTGERPSDIADKYNITLHDLNEIKKRILCKFKDELKNQYNINTLADIP